MEPAVGALTLARGREPKTGLVHAFRKNETSGNWLAWCRQHVIVSWTRWERVDGATVTCVRCAVASSPEV